MTKYMISFPSGAMQFAPEEFDDVVRESHEVIREAKAAGVYVFGGGVNEEVPPVRVSADGTVTPGHYPQTGDLFGGYTIIEAPTRADAESWAARIAAACRRPQELREFAYDPES